MCSMKLWMGVNNINHMVRSYEASPPLYHIPTKNFLCCDARALEKLFAISAANHYWNCPHKQCCLWCPKTHREVRQWSLVDTPVRSHGDHVRTLTAFEWHQVVPDYLLHGNRNWWCRALGGVFSFLEGTDCRSTLAIILTRCQQVDDRINTSGTVEITWPAAGDLLKVDFRALNLPVGDPVYHLSCDRTEGMYDEGEVCVELLCCWQEIYFLTNVTGWACDTDVHRVQDLCGLMRQCIAIMIPHGFNPTMWMHVIAYHMDYHLLQFGNLRRFGLWGQEAKHQDFRKKYHTGPLKGSKALAYGMDMQKMDYKLRADHLPELEHVIRRIPQSLRNVEPEVVMGGNVLEEDL